MVLSVPKLRANPFLAPIWPESRVWNNAQIIHLCDVVHGKATQNTTRLKLGHWENHLCLCFHCVASTVKATFSDPGDPLWEEEAVEVFLQPPHSRHEYFEIDLNPLNTVTQLKIFNNGLLDHNRRYEATTDWRCVGLQSRTFIDGMPNHAGQCKMWLAEMLIPLNALTGLTPNPALQWRANFFRVDAGMLPFVYQAWQPTGKIDFHRMQHFAVLRFGP